MNKVVVVSETFHEIPQAKRVLEESDCEVCYVIPMQEIKEIAEEQMSVKLSEANALIIGGIHVDAEVLARANNLRVVSVHRSGYDKIDVDAATQRGIFVTNVKGVNADQCADFTIGLMIALVRQILRGDKALRNGKWCSETALSSDVTGATLGIIGLGQIGAGVAKRAMGFDMKLLATVRRQDPELAKRFGIEFVGIDELLRRSDIVSLHVPLSEETRGLIGEKELRLMKNTSFLINTARGGIVDEKALHRALTEGWIAGAALDAYEQEPLYSSPLFGLHNIILTPHQSGLTEKSMVGAAVRTAKNAVEVMRGNMTPDVLNAEAGKYRRNR